MRREETTMAVTLSYYVWVDSWDEVEYKFLFGFQTRQISHQSTAAREKAVQNEVEVGGLFTAIKSHKVFSIVVLGGNSHAVHTFLGMKKNQPILQIKIAFLRQLERQEAVMDPPPNFYSPPVFRYEKARCSQDIAAMTMKRVELRDFRATEDESYTADMKVNGDIVTRYEPAGECTEWVKPVIIKVSG
jgi:hypothetical protein